MALDGQNHPSRELGEVMITTVLRVEHRLLRDMMEDLAEWLSKASPGDSAQMRGRISLLGLALEAHAAREEQHLFAHLRPLSERAVHLVDMMVLVHDEVRGLLEEIEMEENPKEQIWTILDLTETHFVKEDEQVFPLAEELLSPETLYALSAQG